MPIQPMTKKTALLLFTRGPVGWFGGASLEATLLYGFKSSLAGRVPTSGLFRVPTGALPRDAGQARGLLYTKD